MPNKFDAKSFNPQAFKYKADRIPRTRMNEMRKSRVLTGNPDIRAVFTTQDGTAYARLAMRGLLDGDAVNYDGQTDITATSTKTFEQGVPVIGRAKAWTEKDFSYDITGGKDFMQNIAEQVAEYWTGVDQDTILAILEGVFNMGSITTPDTKSKEFCDLHTYDVSGADDGLMAATTLNSAMQQACGANKKKFSMVFMHSVVATNLENLNLIKHLTYTDKDGLTRDLDLYTWNGRLVVVDDNMRTNVPHIFAIGDVNARMMLAHVASFQGVRALNAIDGVNDDIRFDVVPSAVFTNPECGMVGLTEEECKSRGMEIETGKGFFRANGKSLALGETEGLCKLIFEKETGLLVGAHIMGPESALLAQQCCDFITARRTRRDIEQTIFGHPTLSEVILSACR